MSRIRKKRKADTVRLSLISSRGASHGERLKTTRLSVPLVQSSTADSRIPTASIADQGKDKFTDEVDDLYLSHDFDPNASSSSSHSSKKRTHESREEKAAESWAKLRDGLLTSLIECCRHPMNMQCIMCSVQLSVVYCQDCGAYMCTECVQTLHTNINIFHAPVMWKVSINVNKIHE